MADAFDWLAFFNEHNILYTTTGPNVSKGRAAIKCPFCGPNDPSEHLVVNLYGGNWWCWRRRSEHKGRSPEWLIQNLIHCSFDQARVISGGVAISEDFFNQVQALLNPNAQEHVLTNRELQFPKEFKPFSGLPSSRPFARYMTKRGFDAQRITTVFTKRYGLRYATSGAFSGRIIFPVRHGGRLIGWTGRAVTGRNVTVRYKALTTDAERAKEEGISPALAPINHHLLWFDRLMKADTDTVCLTEGPFDALKVEELGRNLGVSATCFFTSAPTEQQVGLLHQLLPRFKKRYLIPDRDAVHFALQTMQKLSALGVEVKMLPDGIKDPALLDKNSFATIL